MFPGIGGINPSQIKGMMKKLGINQTELDAERVIIEKKDGGRVIIEEPSVQKIVMQGQESFQISGEVREEEDSRIKEEDVRLVMEKTGKDEGEVREALEEANGDIAEAIVMLSS